MAKFTLIAFLLISFNSNSESNNSLNPNNSVRLVVLGIAQDAGYPQLNCYKPHCMKGWKDKGHKKTATSLGLIDYKNKQKYLFEATPDIKEQLYNLHNLANDSQFKLSGIFITHAHIGHYTGLMHFGREAAGTKDIPVYAMPKMKSFLEKNGPWNQLVKLNNIKINALKDQKAVILNELIKVEPFLVPHRDEFSETVGYKIYGPSKTAMFIPDIDKWEKWKKSITDEIKKVDFALLDATFYENGEIPNRDMSEIPHPFVSESMDLFSNLSVKEKNKIIFIHFNHSNPLLFKENQAHQNVINKGYRVATEGLELIL